MRVLLPSETPTWRRVWESATRLSELRGYGEIVTPILEPAELFQRGVGAGTDVVDKEMYAFEDAGGRAIALRPEATASTVRAYFETGLHQAPQPVRLQYQGPMFRHDKPQKGRYRQFFQYGVEAIGDGSPLLDVEVIELAHAWLVDCGIEGAGLEVNSIGDEVCRPAYREKLRDYYRPHLPDLCDDDRRRFEINPMRLLDCKKPGCQRFKAGAPVPVDNLCGPCAEHHGAVLAGLDGLGVSYRPNPHLVRGLDYYTRTAFEFWDMGHGGAQNAYGGGGRYDGLADVMGFASTPGVGFAMGVDRVVLALQESGAAVAPPRPDAYVVWTAPSAPAAAEEPPTEGLKSSMYGAEQRAALGIAATLRTAGFAVTLDPGGRSMKAQMRQAERSGAALALILGDDEFAQSEVTLRHMVRHEQERVSVADLPAAVARVLR